MCDVSTLKSRIYKRKKKHTKIHGNKPINLNITQSNVLSSLLPSRRGFMIHLFRDTYIHLCLQHKVSNGTLDTAKIHSQYWVNIVCCLWYFPIKKMYENFRAFFLYISLTCRTLARQIFFFLDFFLLLRKWERNENLYIFFFISRAT